jgi:lipase ATG15
MISALPSTLRLFVASLLWPGGTEPLAPAQVPLRNPTSLRFHLRHEHGLTNTSRNVIRDIPTMPGFAPDTFDFGQLGVAPVTVHRPSSAAAFQRARYGRFAPQHLSTLSPDDLWWEDEEVPAPNVTNRATLLVLAQMANNAYYDDKTNDKGWYDMGTNWTVASTLLLHQRYQLTLYSGISCWMGARRRRLPWPCLCVRRQLDRCGIH